jgi:hypothetical protein
VSQKKGQPFDKLRATVNLDSSSYPGKTLNRMDDEPIIATATIWQWRPEKPSAASWYFVTIDGQTSAEIRYAALGRTGGFGSVRVTVTLGETTWQTSLFPHKDSGGFLLPMKAAVRKAEDVGVGDVVTVRLEV